MEDVTYDDGSDEDEEDDADYAFLPLKYVIGDSGYKEDYRNDSDSIEVVTDIQLGEYHHINRNIKEKWWYSHMRRRGV